MKPNFTGVTSYLKLVLRLYGEKENLDGMWMLIFITNSFLFLEITWLIRNSARAMQLDHLCFITH